MEWAHAYVLLLGAVATALLAFDKAHLSVVGTGLILAVAIPGLVTPAEAVAGFGNKAVVTVGALFVVGEGFLLQLNTQAGTIGNLEAPVLEDQILRRKVLSPGDVGGHGL